MSPQLVEAVIWLAMVAAVIIAVIWLASLLLMIVPGVLIAGWIAHRAGMKVAPMAILKNLKRLDRDACLVSALMVGAGLAIDLLAYEMFKGLGDLAGGSILMGLLQAMLWGSLLLICGVAYFHNLKGNEGMKNIFDLASDPNALDDFCEGESTPIMIDAAALEEYARTQVIGQDRVIAEMAATVSRRAKLNRPGKPLGVFMFVGPTGVGKTELAKAIADASFEGRLVRFDMNECTDSSSVSRLIGSPPGYIGSEAGGQLTQAIFTKKSGVLLFDEIEKAHEDLYKVLMGLMDEGRITEASSGRVANASKFVIVLTSNAEHEKLGQLADTMSNPEDLRRAVKDTLRTVFKPEQLARIDDVFCFNKLDRRGVIQVVGKFLMKFAAECQVEIAKVQNELLVDTVLKHEKQSEFGIRELVRLVEKAVVDGMLDAREAGFKHVAINVINGEVRVEGVEDPEERDHRAMAAFNAG